MRFFIAGGTGFVGRHLIDALRNTTFSARCLVRSEERAKEIKLKGFETVIGDITDRESLKGRLDGCDIVVHLVGIIEEKGDMTFHKIHVKGTFNLVEEAKKANIKHIFYQSALGASITSWSVYYKTKAEAEDIVRNSGIPHTIFRPSLIIGKGDGFTERIKELIMLGPFVPIPGEGNARFQPIYIDDWVKCFFKVFSEGSQYLSGIYELGGTEHLTYNEIVIQIMEALGETKPIIHVPLKIIKMGLPISGLASRIGNLIGKKIPHATKEQLLLLQQDNICDLDIIKKNFGFEPIKFREALKRIIKN